MSERLTHAQFYEQIRRQFIADGLDPLHAETHVHEMYEAYLMDLNEKEDKEVDQFIERTHDEDGIYLPPDEGPPVTCDHCGGDYHGQSGDYACMVNGG